jgi:hypothetical protein
LPAYLLFVKLNLKCVADNVSAAMLARIVVT